MRRFCSVLVPLLLALACRRPDVEAFARNPLPISVVVEVPADLSTSDDLKQECETAIRARLAMTTMVVPAQVKPPADHAELRVYLTQAYRPTRLSPGEVGAITGIAVGTLSAISGNRDAWFDGLFWGLWAGSNHEPFTDHPVDDLLRISAAVKLVRAGSPDPLASFAVSGSDVVEAIISGHIPVESADSEGVARQEADAFAQFVVGRLQEKFSWLPLAQASYYEPPALHGSVEPTPDPLPIHDLAPLPQPK